ncbi:MAG: SMI1/KNR4 family protein, partial [Phenylobacterium sp.]|nr:SMI1/KNR4 family protein [Phenylobacterium sp.]
MDISVREACRSLEAQGALRRRLRGSPDGLVAYVRELLGDQMPADLEALYREGVEAIGDFRAVIPKWNERPERRREGLLRALLPAQAVPIFSDGAGNLYGLDLSSGAASPAVYFFDHEDL